MLHLLRLVLEQIGLDGETLSVTASLPRKSSPSHYGQGDRWVRNNNNDDDVNIYSLHMADVAMESEVRIPLLSR